jgi:hypothetical protein
VGRPWRYHPIDVLCHGAAVGRVIDVGGLRGSGQGASGIPPVSRMVTSSAAIATANATEGLTASEFVERVNAVAARPTVN